MEKYFFAILVMSLTCFAEYQYDPEDFATEVVRYVEGNNVGIYNDPATALGRPSVDVSYYGAIRPTVQLFPPWQTTKLVRVGDGGELVLKFAQPVFDDPGNPWGVDFIIFSNQLLTLGNNANYYYQDPALVYIYIGLQTENRGIVSVSQDDVNWYSYSEGPFTDSFAPTMGRRYDPANAWKYEYANWDNLWWADVTDPTLPLNPDLPLSEFRDKTLAELASMYGRSAGGTGFDLKGLSQSDYDALEIDPDRGLKWIQYVKIECPAGVYERPIIDAVSKTRPCDGIWQAHLSADIDNSKKVDHADLYLMSCYWLSDISGDEYGQKADLNDDGLIDLFDFAEIANQWNHCSIGCE